MEGTYIAVQLYQPDRFMDPYSYSADGLWDWRLQVRPQDRSGSGFRPLTRDENGATAAVSEGHIN